MNTQTRTTRAERDPMYNLERELKIRGFSPKTIKAYLHYNRKFLIFARGNPKIVRNEDIKRYLEYLVKREVSNSTLNLAINALKFYYEGILKRRFFYTIKHAKKEKKLPIVLSKEEVNRMIKVTENAKHKFLISIIYSAGLRVSEAIKIKMRDVDLDRKMLKISSGKGKKDRYVVLAEKLIPTFEKQFKVKKADDYLFSGARGRGHLTTGSAEKIVKMAAKKARISKNVSCHTLRHSFATHLLEKGVNIRYIQELLGHKRLETTQIYTKVASNKLQDISSPLDDL